MTDGTKAQSRYHVISALLQAEAPLSLDELQTRVQIPPAELTAILAGLAGEELVVAGDLVPGRPGPQYAWAARVTEQVGRTSTTSRETLQAAVREAPRTLAIDSEAVRTFNHFVIHEYTPPPNKPYLVFFQCSVRRPFSTSPSHGTIKRAIVAATGYNPSPGKQFEECPVHVVVLASHIGPVPYELEDIYPANVGGGGVKNFHPDYYATVRPILARRMADYLRTHGPRYEHMAAFTDGRYGEVMKDAQSLAGTTFAVFPSRGAPRILSRDGKAPRKYWDKCWIQLYLEIRGWLNPSQRKEADARLAKMKVVYG